MSEAEQRAVIGSGMTDVQDLPDDFRALVDEMVEGSRPQPSSL
jgi:hypothetical protein